MTDEEANEHWDSLPLSKLWGPDDWEKIEKPESIKIPDLRELTRIRFFDPLEAPTGANRRQRT